MRKVFLFVAMAAMLAVSGGCGNGGSNGGEKPAPTVTTFSVTVDYSRSLAKMIAAGKYDYVNLNITEANFPISRKDKVEVKFELVHFNRAMSSNDVCIELNKKLGLRPATLPELLAFGAAYPIEQRKYPIVALGSVWRGWGGRGVPSLWHGSGGSDLDLYWYEDDWYEFYRFLAVRESR